MIEKFIADLERRQYSPHTLRAYRRTLERLQAHSEQPPHQVDTKAIRAFLTSLGSVSNVARSLHISAVKAYALFLRKTGVECALADMRGLRSPKHTQSLPRPLSEDAAKAVIGLASRPTHILANWEVARNRALILALYGAGLRSAEVLSLPFRIETDKTLRVFGKGRKERLVPLLPVVSQAIDTYRRLYSEAHQDAPKTLFGGFSDRSLRRLVEGYRKQLRLPNTFTPHALRHSFATHLYQNGADLMVLADLLGHASVSTTAIYTQVDKNSLSKVLSECYGDRYEITASDEQQAA